jgi:hypothetical protein
MHKRFNKKIKIIISIFLLALIILASPYIVLFITTGLAEYQYVNRENVKAEKTYITGFHIQEHLPIKNNYCIVSNLYFLSQGQYDDNKRRKYLNEAINIAKINVKGNHDILAKCYGDLAYLVSCNEVWKYPTIKIKGTIKPNPKIKIVENYYNSAMELDKKYNSQKSQNVYLSNLAGFYTSIKMYDKAESIYLKIISPEDKKNYLFDLVGLFDLYQEKKEYKKAENLLINNISILGSKNFINNNLKTQRYQAIYIIYSELSEIYKKKKDYKKANYFNKIALSYGKPQN